MNVKFINPFIEAACEVLEVETGTTLVRGELGLEKGPYVTDDVTVIISLVGRLTGTVFYSLAQQTAVSIAGRILRESLNCFDGLAQSGIAELGNVITGRASVKLSEAGFEATISPPTMLLGKGASISTLDFPRLVVPFQSSYGTVAIHVALRESVDKRTTAAIPVPAKPSLALNH